MAFVPDQPKRSRFVPDAPPQAPQVQPPGMVEGLLQQFNQGLSLGTADEIVAGAEKLGGGDYTASMRQQQAEREAFAAEHPYLASAAVGVGGIAPIAASMFLAPQTAGAAPAAAVTGVANQVRNAFMGRAFEAAPTTAAAMWQGAKYGMGFGAPAGYASADPEAPGGRAAGAAKGAATGAVFGAGIPLAMGAWEKFSPKLAQWGDQITPTLENVAENIGVSTRPPGSFAVPQNRLPAALTGDRPPPPGSAAERKLLRALNEAGIPPEAASLYLERARELNVPLTLMDVGGQPMLRLARGTRSLPGEGSATIDAALEARAASQPARVKSAVEQGTGARMGGNPGGTSDALLKQARADAGPLYAQLEQFPVQDPRLLQLFEVPGARGILQSVEKARGAFQLPTVMGRSPLYTEDGRLARAPTMADINDLNVTINEMMSPNYERMGGRPVEGIDLTTQEGRYLAEQFRQEMNRLAEMLPGGDVYKAARAAYSGPADARTHYDRGLGFTNPNTPLEDVAAQMRDTTPTQNQWYRAGVADSIGTRIDQMPDLGAKPNVLRSFWGNPNARARFDLVAANDASKLNERFALENLAAQNSNYVRGGSQTTDKAFEATDVAMDFGEKLTTGTNAKTAAAQALWGKIRGQFGNETRAEIARLITEVDPAKQQAVLQRLALLNAQGKLRADQVGRIIRAVTVQSQSQ